MEYLLNLKNKFMNITHAEEYQSLKIDSLCVVHSSVCLCLA